MHEQRRQWIHLANSDWPIHEPTSTTDLRHAQSILAALRTAANRQSPPEIGQWEYQRDRHRIGVRWESEWLAQLESSCERGALLTTSGMAAISTTLAYLERSLPASGTVLVDSGVYHETRHLLATGALADRCVVIDSEDLFDAIGFWKPVAVFVDAVSNRPDVRVTDLDALRQSLVSSAREAVAVVDTSVCSMMDPTVSRQLDAFDTPLIVVESLTKHAQLGLDRIPGGLIVSNPETIDELDRLREHLGSNITDLACAALPDPNRSLMLRRLDRQSSNAAILASRLHRAGLPVAHPTLSNHPDHFRIDAGRAGNESMRCGGVNCCIIGLPSSGDGSLVASAVAAANRRGLLLENGVGFGFDTTRIYQTSQSIPEASAFVRIAAGIEPIDVICGLADAIVEGYK